MLRNPGCQHVNRCQRVCKKWRKCAISVRKMTFWQIWCLKFDEACRTPSYHLLFFLANNNRSYQVKWKDKDMMRRNFPVMRQNLLVMRHSCLVMRKLSHDGFLSWSWDKLSHDYVWSISSRYGNSLLKFVMWQRHFYHWITWNKKFVSCDHMRRKIWCCSYLITPYLGLYVYF